MMENMARFFPASLRLKVLVLMMIFVPWLMIDYVRVLNTELAKTLLRLLRWGLAFGLRLHDKVYETNSIILPLTFFGDYYVPTYAKE